MQIFTIFGPANRFFFIDKGADGKFRLSVPGKDPVEVPDKMIKEWDFTTKPYTGDTSISLARMMAAANVYGPNGIGDADAIQTARGTFLAQLLITDWNRTTDTGEKMPVTTENIGALPKEVLKVFGMLAEKDGFPTLEDIEAAKND